MTKNLLVKKNYIIIIAGIVLLTLVVIVFFILRSTKKTEQPSDFSSSITLDPIDILEKALKRQENSNYLVEYDILLTGGEEILGKDKVFFRKIEKKHENKTKIDSYLSSDVLVNSFIINDEGKFTCNFIESQVNPTCYKLPNNEPIIEDGQTYLNISFFKKLFENGAIEAKASSEKIILNGKERACSRIDYSLDGKKISDESFSPLISLIPNGVSPEEVDRAKAALSLISIQSSICFDQETGIPLTSTTTSIIEGLKEETVKTATSLAVNPEFSHTLELNLIIEKDTESSFKGEYRLLEQETNGNYLYLGGGKGVYLIKDGELEKHYPDVGNVRALKFFNGVLYAGTTLDGIQVLINDSWEKSSDVYNVIDFEIFNSKLYAGTSTGVYVLENNHWVQPDESFKKLSAIENLASGENGFYANTSLNGVFVLENNDWKQIKAFESGKWRRLRVRQNKVFLITPDGLAEIKDGKPETLALYDKSGSVNNFVVFNDAIYIGSNKGIYSTKDEIMADKEKVGRIEDIIIFQNNIYAAGDSGVFKLQNNEWQRVGSFYTLSKAHQLLELKGTLYAAGALGVYRFEGDDWTFLEIWPQGQLIAAGDRLYVVTGNGAVLNEIIIKPKNPSEAFILPEGAKRIDL